MKTTINDAVPMSEDAADLQWLLSAHPGNGILTAPYGRNPSQPGIAEAFARSVLNGWIALIDIAPTLEQVPGKPPTQVMQRIFRLTLAGQARIAELRTRARL